MSRPLRIEFEGALYHVTSRGNARQDIYLSDGDRRRFLELLAREVAQQRWLCHAYCLMDNHYHLMIETPEANLSRGMARLNMSYSQWFNHRQGRVGHLFQGRYQAILVQKQTYLFELCRYVVLNPVRAGMVENAGDWPWSSYRPTVGACGAPAWLTTSWVLEQFGGRANSARNAYQRFVAEGMSAPPVWEQLRGRMFLGSEEFLKDMAGLIEEGRLDQIPKDMSRPDRPDAERICKLVAAAAGIPVETVYDRKARQDVFQATVYLLRRACNLPLKQVAALAMVSPSRISRIQHCIEKAGGLGKAFAWARPLERLWLVCKGQGWRAKV